MPIRFLSWTARIRAVLLQLGSDDSRRLTLTACFAKHFKIALLPIQNRWTRSPPQLASDLLVETQTFRELLWVAVKRLVAFSEQWETFSIFLCVPARESN